MNVSNVTINAIQEEKGLGKVGDFFGNVGTWLGHKVTAISTGLWNAIKACGKFFQAAWEKIWDLVISVTSQARPIIEKIAQETGSFIKLGPGLAALLGAGGITAVIVASITNNKPLRIVCGALALGLGITTAVVLAPIVAPAVYKLIPGDPI